MDEKERIYGERYPIDEDFLSALAVMPQACGIALDRRTEKARQARIVGPQGLSRAAVQSAVAARFADDAWARVGDRA